MMPNCSVGPPECEAKLTSKHFDMGYVKMHVFFMATPYTIFEKGGGGRPLNSSISRVLLIPEH